MVLSSTSPMKLELPTKPIQELLKTSGKQIPKRYIQHLSNETDYNNDNSPEIKYMDNCIIDLSLLSSSSSSNKHQEELQKLRSILTSWGCLQLVNHGLSNSLINQIHEVGKEFFALPLELKQKHWRTVNCNEGYGGDATLEDQSYNWNDRLRLKVFPLNQRNFEFWPEYLPNFRKTLEEYTMELKRVHEMLLNAIAKSLNLEENSFNRECGGNEAMNMFIRFNYYPPCSNPNQVLGIKPHSDGSTITFLLQDKEVEGLQIQKDNKWFKVPIIPNALFINLGDQMEIMSNGIMKSVIHKVVVDKEIERTSVALACFPHPDKEIGPLSDLIDKQRPPLYNKVKNYFDGFLTKYYFGERGINDVKALKLGH